MGGGGGGVVGVCVYCIGRMFSNPPAVVHRNRQEANPLAVAIDSEIGGGGGGGGLEVLCMYDMSMLVCVEKFF